MPLPSQMARSSIRAGNRNYRQRRRRRAVLPLTGPGLALAALLAVVLVAVAWWGWGLIRPGDASENATPEAGDDLASLNSAELGNGSGGTSPAVSFGALDRPLGISNSRSNEQTGERRPNATPSPGNQTRVEPTEPAEPVVIDQSRPTPTAGSDLGEALDQVRRTASGDDEPGSNETPDGQELAGTTGPASTGPGASNENGSSAGSSSETLRVVRAAERAVDENDPLLARELLNRLLTSGELSESDARVIRDRLSTLNRDLLFSPRVVEGDPFTSSYTVATGDSLSRIAGREELNVHWRLLQRVNRIDDPRRIRVGQTIKLVHGPFHAVVHKHGYRLDLFAGPADTPSEWVYIASMPCGLGADNSTPVGEFVVRENSKLENPHWVNPRTGERFDADDPDNPIGERWIGIKGLGEYEALTGYGLHGTIEPGSIGSDASMGCVRLHDDDVNIVYELLVEQVSRVTILP